MCMHVYMHLCVCGYACMYLLPRWTASRLRRAPSASVSIANSHSPDASFCFHGKQSAIWWEMAGSKVRPSRHQWIWVIYARESRSVCSSQGTRQEDAGAGCMHSHWPFLMDRSDSISSWFGLLELWLYFTTEVSFWFICIFYDFCCLNFSTA